MSVCGHWGHRECSGWQFWELQRCCGLNGARGDCAWDQSSAVDFGVIFWQVWKQGQRALDLDTRCERKRAGNDVA